MTALLFLEEQLPVLGVDLDLVTGLELAFEQAQGKRISSFRPSRAGSPLPRPVELVGHSRRERQSDEVGLPNSGFAPSAPFPPSPRFRRDKLQLEISRVQRLSRFKSFSAHRESRPTTFVHPYPSVVKFSASLRLPVHRSPRPNGERVGARGFKFKRTTSPSLSPNFVGGEGENSSGVKSHPLAGIFTR